MAKASKFEMLLQIYDLEHRYHLVNPSDFAGKPEFYVLLNYRSEVFREITAIRQRLYKALDDMKKGTSYQAKYRLIDSAY